MEIASTRRPLPATVLAVIQTLIAVMNIIVMIIVVLAVREIGPHATHPEHQVTLDVILTLLAALGTSFAALGLWKRWAVSWALTLALGLTVALALLWGPMFDHDHMEPDDRAVVAAYLVTIALALLPSVRHWYLRRRSATTVAANSAQVRSGYER